MGMLEILDVQRSFDDQPVLRGVDLTIAEGEIVCLLGASGSGKTTLLRIIAGLESADSGDVRLTDQSILPIPVHRRDFGFMFQDFALFPHLNVQQNVAFGLRMRRVHRRDQQARVAEVLDLVGLSGFEKRDVTELSGGERQRVALARSLAPNPRLLLLDEPLGSLDAALRERLAVELREIIKQTGLTAIHVTHDQQEAYAIADRIAIMHRGVIEQVNTPEALYYHPETTYVAQFLGLNNIVPVEEHTDQEVRTSVGLLSVQSQDKTFGSILLHPEGIELVPDADFPSAYPILSMIVREVVFLGDAYRIVACHESGVCITFRCYSPPVPEVGQPVLLQIDPKWILPLVSLVDHHSKEKR
jgi:ABC-type Fe3+/spermidine/putrescine transport system ATPase subunit